MNELGDFNLVKGKHKIKMIDAFQYNQMHELGDKFIATESPLVFRIICEQKKLDTIKRKETVVTKIINTELVSTKGIIIDKEIKTLAFYLFLLGKWPISDCQPIIEEGNLIGWNYLAEPEEMVENQNSQIIATLSSLYTKMSLLQTKTDENLPNISSPKGFTSVDKIIPSDPFHKGLPLWVFVMHPKSK